MVDDVAFPDLVPVMSYRYDMTRAGIPQSTLGRPEQFSNFYWHTQANMIRAQVLYGLAHYVTPRGWECTVECGALVFPMYDFCGGVVVSSCMVRSYDDLAPTDTFALSHRWYRSHLPGASAEAEPASHGAGVFQSVKKFIPSLSAYTGRETHTQSEAQAIIEKSLASAILSCALQGGRRGLFAADRVTYATSTLNIMRRLNGRVRYWPTLPYVQFWPGQNFDNGELMCREFSGGRLTEADVTFSPGTPYTNPNSGHVVALCSAVAVPNASFIRVHTSKLEEDKFKSPEFVAMLPQAMYHN